MAKYTNEITQCLEALNKLPEVLTALKEIDGSEPAVFLTELSEALEAKITQGNLNAIVPLLESGQVEDLHISNQDDFKAVQRFATEAFGDWNTDAVRFAVVKFQADGGTILSATDRELTIGELFGVECNVPCPVKVTVSELLQRDESDFAGPNRTIPITSIGEVALARHFWEKFGDDDVKIKINEKLAPCGIHIDGEANLAFQPIRVQVTESEVFAPTTLSSVEEIDTFLTSIDEFCEAYQLDSDTKNKIQLLVEDWKNLASIVINEEFNSQPLIDAWSNSPKDAPLYDGKILLEWYKTTQNTQSFLLPLVGVVRSLKISEEQLETYSKPYSIFDPIVLEKLLKKPFPAEATESAAPPIAPVSNSLPSEQAIGESQTPEPFYKAISKPRRSSTDKSLKENR